LTDPKWQFLDSFQLAAVLKCDELELIALPKIPLAKNMTVDGNHSRLSPSDKVFTDPEAS
jgi:hypothetical protein